MKKKSFEAVKKLYIRTTNCLLTVILTAIFGFFWMTELNEMMTRDFLGTGNYLILTLYFIMTILFFRAFNAYKIGVLKSGSIVLSQILALICINVIALLQIVLMVGRVAKVSGIFLQILRVLGCEIVLCILLTFLLNKIYYWLFPPYHMIEIYGNYKNQLHSKIGSRGDKYIIGERVHISEPLEDIEERLLGYDAVLLNDIPAKMKNKLLKFCFENSIRVYFTPKISDILVKGTDEVDLFDSPLFLCKNIGLTFGERSIKRCMDIVISVLLLIISSPVFLIISLFIKIYDRGPVFFLQERCTKGGEVFVMCKFRSMIENAEEDGKSRPATDNDSRITPVGKIIRATRLDELPQLFNILKGDMSFIGPRPERVEHVEKYSKQIPEFSYRMKVKAGLTGYAQVYGKYNTSAYDKLKMDLMYIVNYSIVMDLKILLMTIKVIFMKESTEGFGNNQKEEMNVRSVEEFVGNECGTVNRE